MPRYYLLPPLAILILVGMLIQAGTSVPPKVHAQDSEAGMSIQIKTDCDDAQEITNVTAGEPFVVCVFADPAPATQISGFATEVLFDDGLEWQRRERCQDEVQLERTDPGESLALCIAYVTVTLRGAAHAVISSAEFPVPALNLTPNSVSPIVEMDFVCTLGGSYTLVLTTVPDSSFGSLYGDLDAFQTSPKTVEYDYDGDGVPNQVADFVTIDCSGPTATPCPPAGCPTATISPPSTIIAIGTPENLTATAEVAATEFAEATSDATADGNGAQNEEDGGGSSTWLWVGLGVAAVVLVAGAGYDGWRRYSRRQQS